MRQESPPKPKGLRRLRFTANLENAHSLAERFHLPMCRAKCFSNTHKWSLCGLKKNKKIKISSVKSSAYGLLKFGSVYMCTYVAVTGISF